MVRFCHIFVEVRQILIATGKKQGAKLDDISHVPLVNVPFREARSALRVEEINKLDDLEVVPYQDTYQANEYCTYLFLDYDAPRPDPNNVDK